jgi:isocitrate lyase
MRELGLFSDVQVEIGQIIVGQVDPARIAELVAPDRGALDALIRKASPTDAGSTQPSERVPSA